MSAASGGHRVGRHRRGSPLALRHSVLIVPTPVGVEFHLDHRVGHGRGQHRVVGAAAFTAWIADAGDHPEVLGGAPGRRPPGDLITVPTARRVGEDRRHV